MQRHQTYKRGFRANIPEVVPGEVRPEWTPYTWKSPLQKWAEQRRLARITATNIYHVETLEKLQGLSYAPTRSTSSPEHRLMSSESISDKSIPLAASSFLHE
eukprot:GHVT01087199.1.p1 GENE.GHVT01087199.1~~GHVT01087199.1.p1  ORF type:complete len:102 (+),score=3.31 GHVT01087199.1:2156-2461(+)